MDGLWSLHSSVGRRHGRVGTGLRARDLPSATYAGTGKHLSETGKGVALTMDVESHSLVEQRATRLHATGSRGRSFRSGLCLLYGCLLGEAATKPLNGRPYGAWQSFVMCRMQRMIRLSTLIVSTGVRAMLEKACQFCEAETLRGHPVCLSFLAPLGLTAMQPMLGAGTCYYESGVSWGTYHNA